MLSARPPTDPKTKATRRWSFHVTRLYQRAHSTVERLLRESNCSVSGSCIGPCLPRLELRSARPNPLDSPQYGVLEHVGDQFVPTHHQECASRNVDLPRPQLLSHEEVLRSF